MSTARYIVGDVFDVLATIPDGSVQSVITSPPYLAKRAYLPADHPAKAKEIGQEGSPAEFLSALLAVTDELWRVLRDDGTIWINLGDTAAFSGGSGGDYNEGGWREGQARYEGSAARAQHTTRWNRSKEGWPLPKSVCWVPELFGASLAYGRNLLSGEPCRQWVNRPPVTWCKPNPTPGEIIDKFREATELIVWGAKQGRYYFDLDSVRTPPAKGDPDDPVSSGAYEGHPGVHASRPDRVCNEKGVPPLNWWKVAGSGYTGSHFATFPPELITRPVIASCPPGGTILDPFAGSGTTLAVATGHGRDAIGIDLDSRNAELALERVGPLLLTVEHLDAQGAA